jgi:hypothetical protein
VKLPIFDGDVNLAFQYMPDAFPHGVPHDGANMNESPTISAWTATSDIAKGWLRLPRTLRARRLVSRRMNGANVRANSGLFSQSSLVTGMKQLRPERQRRSRRSRCLPAFQADHAGSIPVGRSPRWRSSGCVDVPCHH